MQRIALAHWDAYELAFRLRSGEVSPTSGAVLPAFRDVGAKGCVLVVGGDSREHAAGIDDSLVGTLVFQDAVLADLESTPEAAIVRTSADLARAEEGGQVWFVLGLEGCRPLKGRIEVLHAFHRLGIRVLGITWNGRNDAADGVGVLSPGGLTAFGRDVVAEANQLGILLDVSHMAASGVDDVLSHSTRPVMASHSNARALVDHPRNLTDQQIRDIASAGGLIGINLLLAFLVADGPATISDVVRQVDHIASLVGIEHVAIGGDFTYDPWRQAMTADRSFEGVQTRVGPGRRSPVHEVRQLDDLVAGLASTGLSARELDALLYGNLRSLLMQVWSAESIVPGP